MAVAFSERSSGRCQKNKGKKMGVQKVACKNGSLSEQFLAYRRDDDFRFLCQKVVSTSKLLTSKMQRVIIARNLASNPYLEGPEKPNYCQMHMSRLAPKNIAA
jgi:hypothetical protein